MKAFKAHGSSWQENKKRNVTLKWTKKNLNSKPCMNRGQTMSFPKQWFSYQVTCLSRKTPCFFIFRNGPIIGGPTHPKILRKLHALRRNGLNIGWPAHLKIFRKLHAFPRNGLNIRWPAPLKILRKLHAFLRNGLNIGWLPILKFLENSTLF